MIKITINTQQPVHIKIFGYIHKGQGYSAIHKVDRQARIQWDINLFRKYILAFFVVKQVLHDKETFICHDSSFYDMLTGGSVEQFTLGDLAAQLPSASTQLIKKIFAELKKQGKIRLIGRGRGARWEIIP